MTRVSPTVRMLVLLPLVAAGIDLTRATAACGSQAQTCLEAAGRGWLGPVAALLVVAYAAAAGVLVGRFANRRPATGGPRPGFLRLWMLGTTGLVAACAGQDAVARSLGHDAALGGTPLGVLALCAVAGALLALAMRVAADAAELACDLVLRAPRLPLRTLARVVVTGHRPDPVLVTVDARAQERAPPAA